MKIFLLLLILASAINAVPIGKGNPGCALKCEKSEQSYFPDGFSYVYSFKSTTSTKILGGSDSQDKTEVTAKAIVQRLSECDLALKLSEVALENNEKSAEFANFVSKNSLIFSYRDGIIEHICSPEDEKPWVLNFKRGILSHLQISMKNFTSKEVVQETDISGSCETTYSHTTTIREENFILREKSPSKCERKSSSNQKLDILGISSKSLLKNAQIINSEQFCLIDVQSNNLETANCTETHVFSPFDRQESTVIVTTKSELLFLSMQPRLAMTATFDKRSDLEFESYETEKKHTKQNVQDVLESLEKASENGMKREISTMFSELVIQLKNLDHHELEDLMKENTGRSLLFLQDALPLVETDASYKVFVDLILDDFVTEEQADSWLMSLALIRNPSPKLIAALKPLYARSKTGKELLTISTLVHKYCTKNENCKEEPEIQGFLKDVESHLGTGCRAMSHHESENIIIALKALGNAGLLLNSESVLQNCYQENNSIKIRIAAIQAFRRLSCEYNRNHFLKPFSDRSLDNEIRIESYLAMMKCPNPTIIDNIKDRLTSEDVNQVTTFVWTHLTNIQESANPDNNWIRQLIGDEDILTKKFDPKVLKHSRNFESSLFLKEQKLGASFDSNVIFSGKSFIPRSANLNTNINIFGESINLFDIGLRLENFESYIEKFFGQNGYYPEETVAAIVKSLRKQLSQEEDLNEFTPRDNDQDPDGLLSLKILGNELFYKNFKGFENLIPESKFPSIFDMIINLLQKQNGEIVKNIELINTDLTYPTLTGFPLNIKANGYMNLGLSTDGKFDIKSLSSMHIEGKIIPSMNLRIDSQIALDKFVSQSGIKMISSMHSSAKIEGKIITDNGKLIDLKIKLPDDKIELFDITCNTFELKDNGPTSEPVLDISEYCTQIGSYALPFKYCYTNDKNTDPNTHILSYSKLNMSLKKSNPMTKAYVAQYVNKPNEKGLLFEMEGVPDSKYSLKFSREDSKHTSYKVELFAPGLSYNGQWDYAFTENKLLFDVKLKDNREIIYSAGIDVSRDLQSDMKFIKARVHIDLETPRQKLNHLLIDGSIYYDEKEKILSTKFEADGFLVPKTTFSSNIKLKEKEVFISGTYNYMSTSFTGSFKNDENQLNLQSYMIYEYNHPYNTDLNSVMTMSPIIYFQKTINDKTVKYSASLQEKELDLNVKLEFEDKKDGYGAKFYGNYKTIPWNFNGGYNYLKTESNEELGLNFKMECKHLGLDYALNTSILRNENELSVKKLLEINVIKLENEIKWIYGEFLSLSTSSSNKIHGNKEIDINFYIGIQDEEYRITGNMMMGLFERKVDLKYSHKVDEDIIKSEINARYESSSFFFEKETSLYEISWFSDVKKHSLNSKFSLNFYGKKYEASLIASEDQFQLHWDAHHLVDIDLKMKPNGNGHFWSAIIVFDDLKLDFEGTYKPNYISAFLRSNDRKLEFIADLMNTRLLISMQLPPLVKFRLEYNFKSDAYLNPGNLYLETPIRDWENQRIVIEYLSPLENNFTASFNIEWGNEGYLNLHFDNLAILKDNFSDIKTNLKINSTLKMIEELNVSITHDSSRYNKLFTHLSSSVKTYSEVYKTSLNIEKLERKIMTNLVVSTPLFNEFTGKYTHNIAEFLLDENFMFLGIYDPIRDSRVHFQMKYDSKNITGIFKCLIPNFSNINLKFDLTDKNENSYICKIDGIYNNGSMSFWGILNTVKGTDGKNHELEAKLKYLSSEILNIHFDLFEKLNFKGTIQFYPSSFHHFIKIGMEGNILDFKTEISGKFGKGGVNCEVKYIDENEIKGIETLDCPYEFGNGTVTLFVKTKFDRFYKNILIDIESQSTEKELDQYKFTLGFTNLDKNINGSLLIVKNQNTVTNFQQKINFDNISNWSSESILNDDLLILVKLKNSNNKFEFSASWNSYVMIINSTQSNIEIMGSLLTPWYQQLDFNILAEWYSSLIVKITSESKDGFSLDIKINNNGNKQITKAEINSGKTRTLVLLELDYVNNEVNFKFNSGDQYILEMKHSYRDLERFLSANINLPCLLIKHINTTLKYIPQDKLYFKLTSSISQILSINYDMKKNNLSVIVDCGKSKINCDINYESYTDKNMFTLKFDAQNVIRYTSIDLKFIKTLKGVSVNFDTNFDPYEMKFQINTNEESFKIIGSTNIPQWEKIKLILSKYPDYELKLHINEIIYEFLLNLTSSTNSALKVKIMSPLEILQVFEFSLITNLQSSEDLFTLILNTNNQKYLFGLGYELNNWEGMLKMRVETPCKNLSNIDFLLKFNLNNYKYVSISLMNRKLDDHLEMTWIFENENIMFKVEGSEINENIQSVLLNKRSKRDVNNQFVNGAGEFFPNFNLFRFTGKTPFPTAKEVVFEISKTDKVWTTRYIRGGNEAYFNLNVGSKENKVTLTLFSEVPGWELLALTGRINREEALLFLEGKKNSEKVKIEGYGEVDGRDGSLKIVTSLPYDNYREVTTNLKYNLLRRNFEFHSRSSSSDYEILFDIHNGIKVDVLIPNNEIDTVIKARFTPFEAYLNASSRFPILKSLSIIKSEKYSPVYSNNIVIQYNGIKLYEQDLKMNTKSDIVEFTIDFILKGDKYVIYIRKERWEKGAVNFKRNEKEFNIELTGSGTLPVKGELQLNIQNSFNEKNNNGSGKFIIDLTNKSRIMELIINLEDGTNYEGNLNINIDFKNKIIGKFDFTLERNKIFIPTYGKLSGGFDFSNLLNNFEIYLNVGYLEHKLAGTISPFDTDIKFKLGFLGLDEYIIKWKILGTKLFDLDYLVKFGTTHLYLMLGVKTNINANKSDFKGIFRITQIMNDNLEFGIKWQKAPDGSLTGDGNIALGRYNGTFNIIKSGKNSANNGEYHLEGRSNFRPLRNYKFLLKYDFIKRNIEIEIHRNYVKYSIYGDVKHFSTLKSEGTFSLNLPGLGEGDIYFTYNFFDALRKQIIILGKRDFRSLDFNISWTQNINFTKMNLIVDGKSRFIGTILIEVLFSIEDLNNAGTSFVFKRNNIKIIDVKWLQNRGKSNVREEFSFVSQIFPRLNGRIIIEANWGDKYDLRFENEFFNDIEFYINVGHKETKAFLKYTTIGVSTFDLLLKYVMGNDLSKFEFILKKNNNNVIKGNVDIKRDSAKNGSLIIKFTSPFVMIRNLEIQGQWNQGQFTGHYIRNNDKMMMNGKASVKFGNAFFDLVLVTNHKETHKIKISYDINDFIATTSSTPRKLLYIKSEIKNFNFEINVNGFRTSEQVSLEFSGNRTFGRIRNVYAKIEFASSLNKKEFEYDLKIDDARVAVKTSYEKLSNGYYFKKVIKNTFSPIPSFSYGYGRDGESYILTAGDGDSKEFTISLNGENHYKDGIYGTISIPSLNINEYEYKFIHKFISENELNVEVRLQIGDLKFISGDFLYNSQGIRSYFSSPWTGSHGARMKRSISNESEYIEVDFDDYGCKIKFPKYFDTLENNELIVEAFGEFVKIYWDVKNTNNIFEDPRGILKVETSFKNLPTLDISFNIKSLSNSFNGKINVNFYHNMEFDINLNFDKDITGYILANFNGAVYKINGSLIQDNISNIGGTFDIKTPYFTFENLNVNCVYESQNLNEIKIHTLFNYLENDYKLTIILRRDAQSIIFELLNDKDPEFKVTLKTKLDFQKNPVNFNLELEICKDNICIVNINTALQLINIKSNNNVKFLDYIYQNYFYLYDASLLFEINTYDSWKLYCTLDNKNGLKIDFLPISGAKNGFNTVIYFNQNTLNIIGHISMNNIDSELHLLISEIEKSFKFEIKEGNLDEVFRKSFEIQSGYIKNEFFYKSSFNYLGNNLIGMYKTQYESKDGLNRPPYINIEINLPGILAGVKVELNRMQTINSTIISEQHLLNAIVGPLKLHLYAEAYYISAYKVIAMINFNSQKVLDARLNIDENSKDLSVLLLKNSKYTEFLKFNVIISRNKYHFGINSISKNILDENMLLGITYLVDNLKQLKINSSLMNLKSNTYYGVVEDVYKAGFEIENLKKKYSKVNASLSLPLKKYFEPTIMVNIGDMPYKIIAKVNETEHGKDVKLESLNIGIPIDFELSYTSKVPYEFDIYYKQMRYREDRIRSFGVIVDSSVFQFGKSIFINALLLS